MGALYTFAEIILILLCFLTLNISYFLDFDFTLNISFQKYQSLYNAYQRGNVEEIKVLLKKVSDQECCFTEWIKVALMCLQMCE